MTTSNSSSTRRFLFKRLFQVFYRPGKVFEWIASESGRLWALPLAILTITIVIRILVSGWLQARAAMLGEIPLPPDWMYYTPDMQAQYMQAAQATSSPVFVYVLPAVISISAVWLGWGIVSALLHLAFTLTGGRGTSASSLNLVAWAGVPYSLRELLRIIYLIIVRHPITNAGLSGFAPATEAGGSLFLTSLLALVDLFLIWHIVLLIIGAKRTENISAAKAISVILLVIVIVVAGHSGLSFLGAKLSGMLSSRPFYF